MMTVSYINEWKDPYKVYVTVKVSFDADGIMTPLEIKWEDGRVFTVDRVTDVRQRRAEKAGGQGDRYTVMINGKEKYLYFERYARIGNNIGRWFMERKVPLKDAAE